MRSANLKIFYLQKYKILYFVYMDDYTFIHCCRMYIIVYRHKLWIFWFCRKV